MLSAPSDAGARRSARVDVAPAVSTAPSNGEARS